MSHFGLNDVIVELKKQIMVTLFSLLIKSCNNTFKLIVKFNVITVTTTVDMYANHKIY